MCSGLVDPCVWVHATSHVPHIDQKRETTKLSQSSHSNKKGFQLGSQWHRPYLALTIKIPLSQQTSFAQTSFSPWLVRGVVRSIAQEETRLFSSRKLHRSDMSKKFVSPRFHKQLFVLWEPRELGKCRDKWTFGDGCDTCNGDPGDSGVPKRRFLRKR